MIYSKLICSKQLNLVFDIIEENKGNAMLVGGCVRDFLLKAKPVESGDIDIAAALPVDKVAEIFKRQGAKVITKYATNIVVLKDKVFEITSTRQDKNHDGRYAEMIFTPSFEEDSKRRDFTINALYMNRKGEIFDFHNGIQDLQNKKVRFIGDANARIEEDYLRIWRFFRFSCHYGIEMDKDGFDACVLKKEGLKMISAERVTQEMLKLLAAPPLRIKYIMCEMKKGGILPESFVFPNGELPNEPFLRFMSITKAVNITLFLYTLKQKRLLKQYQALQTSKNITFHFYFLYYTLPPADFQNILEVAASLEELPGKKEDFSNLPPLPFSYSAIIEKGFKGAEISKQFNNELEKFIQSLVLSKS